ncbi:uncharacterized protein LOC101901785 [Musca domestica]|uniref:Uncharacterized protein LOC101901785 n=1 Tax=Musca domestica TaxID=7370 RepID=A0A9J7CKS0_MUSDO|nr:uncharacterized protein LOC101901785 [Musca domestica]
MSKTKSKSKKSESEEDSCEESSATSSESQSSDQDGEEKLTKRSKHKNKKTKKSSKKKHKSKSDSGSESSSESSSDEGKNAAKKKSKSNEKEKMRTKQERRPRSLSGERGRDMRSKWESPKRSHRSRDRSRSRQRERSQERDRYRSNRDHRDRFDVKRERNESRDFKRDPDGGYRGNYQRRERSPQRERERSRERGIKRESRGIDNRFKNRRRDDDDKNYEWGKPSQEEKKPEVKQEEKDKEKPNFGLSGALTEDTNKVNGVVIKYAEPLEARKPKRRWRLYPFKGETALPVLHIHRQSCFLVGRDRKVVDLPVDHPSCSKQHAALQYRLVPFEREDGTTGKRVRLYLIDLDSANGTFLNNKRIDARKYYELMEKDVIKFGFSTREYVLLHENSKEDQEDDDIEIKEEN